MDSFLGAWKLQADRNEGPSTDAIRAMEIPEEFIEMFVKAVYTLTLEKVGDQYKYSFLMEGHPELHVAGPFDLGKTFEFYDSFCKRTEQITISFEGNKATEVTVIKEKPSVTWTIHRYLQDGEMITDTEIDGKKLKSYLKKV